MATNLIGLDTTQSQKLAHALNNLLANYQVFYMNTRGYHWNIQGKEFLNCTLSSKRFIPTYS